MSFIKTIKSRSPSKVPWGPPHGRLLWDEVAPLNRTTMVLSFRNAITILSNQAGTPMSDSLVIRILWFYLLNALLKSIIQARIAVGSLFSWLDRTKFMNSIK